MTRLSRLLNQLKGLTNSVIRYPLTAAFLVVAAILTAIVINTQNDYWKYLLACAVGATLGITFQAAYERFFLKQSARFLAMGLAVILTVGYYLIIRPAPEVGDEIGTRTAVAVFALVIAFIWVPVIRSRITFNESFMAVFKAFFQSLLYSAVIYAGCSLIIFAIDQLIVTVDNRAFAHVANIVFVLFAPIFFLSLIPVYPGRAELGKDAELSKARDEAIAKAAHCPKFLEVLISYIIIPLAAVFTLILLTYIVINISGQFWKNNLLESMLVAYSISIILIYILASRLENKFASLFRLIFPKVLVPIVLFQIVSSGMNVMDTGLIFTRYYVILFGIFAAAAGVVLSIVPVRKNGIVAAMLIAFSMVSVIPPVDAFTVSRISQENTLKTVLINNGMLENNTIKPKSALSDADKNKIVLSVQYLSRMRYTEQIPWFPKNFDLYNDFYKTFGFNMSDIDKNLSRTISVFFNPQNPVNIAGYDFLVRAGVGMPDKSMAPMKWEINKSGKTYTLSQEESNGQNLIVLKDKNGDELARFTIDDIFARYSKYTSDKSELTLEEALFTEENNMARLSVVVQNANINLMPNQTNYRYADFYLLVQIK